jgi:curved DNA-binding protein CbpA
MASIKPTFDPYRVLGVLRGATAAEIKAAHRKLAKRYHPDGESGNEIRFLAVQEAYQLLSDPERRGEWDRAHAPGPVRNANGRRRHTGAREPAPDPERARRSAKVRRRWRAPGQRKRTWSAEHVPWWQDFRAGADAPDEAPPATASTGAEATAEDGPDAFAAFDRSSGAAWSAAARRHFRRGTDDLPSRGVWRYRGTQVVTGAEARRVAAEEEEEKTER